MKQARIISLSLQKKIDSSYDVIIGQNLFERVASDLKQHLILNASRYVLITDSNVKQLYGLQLNDLLLSQGLQTDLLSFPAGERSKTRETKQQLEDQMMELGCGRDTCIIALGGGVTTDLAGFIAATYMRGIPYISIPTTLLAAADASVGGKTGVDTPHGKNLVGAFYQPKRVYIDVETWKTLPAEQMQNGLSETIKQAMIGDKKFFEYLENNVASLVASSQMLGASNQIVSQSVSASVDSSKKEVRQAIQHTSMDLDVCLEIALRNVEIKYKIVEKDEKETGQRAILNLGHTIGHAVEALSNYKLLHGFAVSIGMSAEAELAVSRGYLSREHADRLQTLLQNVGLPIRLPEGMAIEQIIKKTHLDKKAREGKARYVFPARIGKMNQFGESWTTLVEDAFVRKVLKNFQ